MTYSSTFAGMATLSNEIIETLINTNLFEKRWKYIFRYNYWQNDISLSAADNDFNRAAL